MMHIEEYCAHNNLSRRQVERRIAADILSTTKLNGQRYIIVPPSVNAPDMDPQKFKEEIRSYVLRAGTGYVKEALKKIAEFERATGTKIRGLSDKVLYKIASGKATAFRKKRCDTDTARNSNLVIAKEKIEAIAAKLYIDCGEPNVRFITTRIIELAERHEMLYEIAAIPHSTLYRYISKWIDHNDFKKSWEYYNRHKDFLKRLPKVHGAFTDNIEFMDYIAFDDRKADVAGSWWFDKVDNKWKLRKVWYWLAIEMHTMMPVGWVIMPREPDSDDVINVLIQSMLSVGLPNKGYLFDNGVGYSERVVKFMERVKLQSSGSGYFTNDFKPVAPYEPTHKANVERFFRFIKDEHDVWFQNYVGGKREDVRHCSKRLMPEDCDHIVEEYIKSADAYLTGDCIARKRNRVIKSTRHKASIGELFTGFSGSHQPYFLSEQSLRWALMDDTQVKKYQGGIKMYRSGVRFNYTDAGYNPSLEGREFIISMLPTDMSRMDLYATEDFTDTYTGAEYEKGQYVCTLQSMNSVPNAELQKTVMKKRKESAKHARMTKEKLLDAALAQFPELQEIVNIHITYDGEAIDVRRRLIERMNDITQSTPLGSIAEFIKTEVAEISIGKAKVELTTTESTESTESQTNKALTIEGREWKMEEEKPCV